MVKVFVGVPVILVLLLVVLASFAAMSGQAVKSMPYVSAPATGAQPPDPQCKSNKYCGPLQPAQEASIKRTAARLIEGGDLNGYPLNEPLKVRAAWLIQHGLTDNPLNLQFEVGYVHSTFVEVTQGGYVWDMSAETEDALRTLNTIWR